MEVTFSEVTHLCVTFLSVSFPGSRQLEELRRDLVPRCVAWPHGSISYPENSAVWIFFRFCGHRQTMGCLA